MNERRSFMAGLLGLAGLSSVKKAAADDQGGRTEEMQRRRSGIGSGLGLLFAYRTAVIKFAPTGQDSNSVTVAGDDVGTTEGVLSGTLIQTFTVKVNTTTGAASTGPDRSVFTDLNRDQITFRYEGIGTFLPPPPQPGSNSLISTGGSLEVTYTVTDATGKYKFLIGRQFPAQVIATNAVNASSGLVGSVYGEVYAHDARSIQWAI